MANDPREPVTAWNPYMAPTGTATDTTPNEAQSTDFDSQGHYIGSNYQWNNNTFRPDSFQNPYAAQGALNAAEWRYANDPSSYRTQRDYQDVIQRQTGGWNPNSDISNYQLGGDPNYAMNERNRLVALANATQGRTGPTADTSQMQPWMASAQNAQGGLFNAASNQNYVAGQQGSAAGNLGLAATGAAYQGQMGAAGQLAALGQLPAGPSAAEMAMRRNTADALQNQASLAASARGGNSALALYGAGQNEAKIGGDSTLAIGQQRASEDLANRTFAANAIQGSGAMYGNAMQGQVSAYGAQSGALGNQSSAFGAGANAYNAAGGLGMQGAGQYGNIATANLGAETSQRGLNDQTGLAYNTIGGQTVQVQSGLNQAYDQSRTGNYLTYRANEQANADKTGRGTITGSAGGDKLLGAGAAAGGSLLAMSDVRAKKNIDIADEKVSDAFRNFGGMTTGKQNPKARNMDSYMGGDAQPLVVYSPYGASQTPSAMQTLGSGLQQSGEIIASDDRVKKLKTDANAAISDAFRQGQEIGATGRREAASIAGTNVEYPQLGGYGYDYKDPNQPGGSPGRHYGPMAQELEQTPAGASVVKDTPHGKAIDTGRLSLLNASETSKLRREVDALKAGQPTADEIRGTNAEYPMAMDRGRGPVVAPTDLVYSSENGGNFRTPDEQLRFAEARRRAPQPTPLFFGEDNGGTFRTAAEQERYARRPDSADAAIARRYPSAKVVSEENRVASLAKDVDQSDAILRRLRAQQAAQQPTAAAAPYSPYGY